MKVRGNVSPNPLDIEPYRPIPGQVEVRIRENIEAISVTDEMTGVSITMYEYDEYLFLLNDKEGLREEINSNMSDWLITGRTLEVNMNASVVRDMVSALEVLGVSE